MAKKDISSLVSGIMGEKAHDNKQDKQTAPDITPEMEDNLQSVRKRNVGRPKKETDASGKPLESRATFIVNPEQIRKIKYISLVNGKLLKDVISDALGDYIARWEDENGSINLPKI